METMEDVKLDANAKAEMDMELPEKACSQLPVVVPEALQLVFSSRTRMFT